jgi:hypothetical protein
MTPNQELQERLRRYLLGQLTDGARDEIEQDLLANDELFEELLVLEDELADEYVDGRLEQADRPNFENHFLATPERKQNLRFARALNRYVTTHEKRRESIGRSGPSGLWSSRSWPLRMAAAFAVVAIIAGALWFFFPRQPSPRNFATLTLTISPNTRDQGVQAPRTKLPLGKDALRIFLRLPNPPPPAAGYRVQLLDTNGESISLGIAGQDAQSVVVEIPGSQLRRGQYALNLFTIKADGTEQRISGSYYFILE